LAPAVLLILAGCGKKGPPIPYDVTVPEPISDLEGVVSEGKVLLRWSLPRGAPDDSEAVGLGEFQVLRAEHPLEEEWCDECPERLEPFDLLKMDKMENFSLAGDRVVYQDTRVSPAHVYVYRVTSITDRGYESDLSNRAVVFWDIPPDAPSRVQGTAEDRETSLRWETVDGAEGYRIYRGRGKGKYGEVPIGVVGPDETVFRDTGLSNEQVYYYTVRSIRRIERTWLEGSGSGEISLTPRDLTPPSPPQALLAIPLATGIELSWQRNIEPDVLGYFVYRRDQEGGEYRRLNEFPLETPIFVDETAILGRSYEYVVTAVDRSPRRNESAFSEVVRLVYVR